jgi:hypothetical protein
MVIFSFGDFVHEKANLKYNWKFGEEDVDRPQNLEIKERFRRNKELTRSDTV